MLEKITQRAEHYKAQGSQVVLVQGLGFVGAAVAAVVAAAKKSSGEEAFFVIGLDQSSPDGLQKVDAVNQGVSPIVSSDPELDFLIAQAVTETKNLCATTDKTALSLADVIVVDIPFDIVDRFELNTDGIKVRLDLFESGIRDIGRLMKEEALVIVESTIPIGLCEKVIEPILQEERAHRGFKKPVELAHAYERVTPGPHYVKSIRQYFRTFATNNKDVSLKVREFLSSFIDTETYPLWELEDTASSELAKLLENSYRATNIAFIHEWTLLAEQIGIDLFKVIDSIRVRSGSHDNMRFPGFGVGGYCLTKDSLLAQWSIKEQFKSDLTLDMTLEALRINAEMPLHTLSLVHELANQQCSEKTILVCGISYLAEIADTRNSPAELFVDELQKTGATVRLHDPYVTDWRERPSLKVYQDFKECLEGVEGIVFTVPHKFYRELHPQELLDRCPDLEFIVDAQNIISDDKAKFFHEAGCRLLGVGKGHWRKNKYHC